MTSLPKIVVLVGPTAVGKTRFALQLAKKFNGEVLSADSRQIYKEMTIGTGKPRGVWQSFGGAEVYMVEGVPHHGLDFVKPDESFSVAEYKKYAYTVLHDIVARGKLPILVGGTGLYIWAVVENLDFTEEADSAEVRHARAKLDAQLLPELLAQLKEIDEAGYEFVDKANKRRVVRALELARTGRSIAKRESQPAEFEFLQIGLTLPKEQLAQNIDARINEQIAAGFAHEAQQLLKKYSLVLPSMSSIGYAQWGAEQRGEMTDSEALDAIKIATYQYAKRQYTWFKRDKKITWLTPNEGERAEKLIAQFTGLKLE